MSVKPIPDGYHTVTPYLVARDVGRVMDFLKQAFGGVELHRMNRPDGTVMHAEVRVGDSPVMLGSPQGAVAPPVASLYVYVEDCDATYARAVAAGGEPIMPPADQFYGDRHGGVKDPAGNSWWIATHIEDVSPEEIARRFEAFQKSKSV